MLDPTIRYSAQNSTSFFAGFTGAFGPSEPEPFDFYQMVPIEGHVWIQGHRTIPGDSSRVRFTWETDRPKAHWSVDRNLDWAIIQKVIGPPGKRGRGRPSATPPTGLRETAPLSASPALFRKFTDLDPGDRDGLLDFANEHGVLGVPEDRFYPSPAPPALFQQIPVSERALIEGYIVGQLGKSPLGEWRDAGWTEWLELLSARNAETHKTWQTEIQSMKAAVAVFDAIASCDPHALNEIVRCRERPGEREVEYGWFHLTHPPKLIGRVSIPPRSVSEAFIVARHYLMWLVGTALKGASQLRLAEHPVTAQPTWRVQPKNLLAAMWYQLGCAIAENKSYAKCRSCNSWFEASSGDTEKTIRKVFCSEACKARDYRKRRDRAKELAEQGLPVQAIVDQLSDERLETDPDTVAKWAEQSSEKKD